MLPREELDRFAPEAKAKRKLSERKDVEPKPVYCAPSEKPTTVIDHR